ncbi:hypothetical protein JOH52_006029 [Sinorhizobium meliloti]|nr:hypothetical protein [Sinorhizobium meliloti]
MLFALRRKTMQPRQLQLFLELDHAGAERFFLGFQRGISAAFAANCAISSATLGSPDRVIVVLNLNRTTASTAEVQSRQPAI